MSIKKRVSEITCIGNDSIPGSYQRIGNILLIKFPAAARNTVREKRMIANSFLKLVPGAVTVCEISGISGELRKPETRFLAGKKDFITLHKEHGIFYKIDVSKTMFSKGNLSERRRLVNLVNKKETVIDMFAGIGYFSLGIAKFSRPCEIISIEKNPESFEMLLENIELNKIMNITPVLGDCMQIAKQEAFTNMADRVIMGYLPGTLKFLPGAFSFLKRTGTIHYHDTCAREELWKKPIGEIKKASHDCGYNARIISKRKVKSFAPNVYHIAVDFCATRA